VAKVNLQLGATLDTLDSGELDKALHKHHSWQRDAAMALREMSIPRMFGIPSGGVISLGGDQPDGTLCGPKQGWYWSIHRISVDGLAGGTSPDQVRILKNNTFVCWITAQPGFVTFGKGALTLKPGDFLQLQGSSLTTTGQVTLTGQGAQAPGVMQWKLYE
jgi:hypothetical protein